MTAVIALLLTLSAASQATEQNWPSAEQQKKMAAKMEPGPQHRELATLEGNWTQEVSYNVGGGKQPLRGSGTVKNRMILGGRFLVSERTSSTPAGPMGPIKIEAMSIYGFDRRTNEYTIIELDTMGTYWVSAAGTPQEDKTIVMSGESLDDHGGAREMRKYDMVLRIVDADTYITQITFKFPNRPPTTLVETTHRRLK